MRNIEKFSAEIAEKIWCIVMNDCCPYGLNEAEIFFWRLRQFDNLMSYNGGSAWDRAFAQMGEADKKSYLLLLENDDDSIQEIEHQIQEILKSKYEEIDLPYD